MAVPSSLRDLLDEHRFIAQVKRRLEVLNQRFSTNLVFHEDSCRKAHRSSINELAILIDSKNEDELYTAFDTFIDILVENLIIEEVFSHLLAVSGRANQNA